MTQRNQPQREPNETPTERRRLRDETAYGRIDVACFRTAEAVVKGSFGEAGGRVWDGGLGDVVEELIRSNVPDRQITAVDIMRELGITKGPAAPGGVTRSNGRGRRG